MNRRDFLKMAALVALGGKTALTSICCSQQDKERDSVLIVDPPQPLVGQWVYFGGEHWTSLDTDVNDIGTNRTTLELGDQHRYLVPGRYFVRATGNTTIDREVIVRHNHWYTEMADALPGKRITRDDWLNFVVGMDENNQPVNNGPYLLSTTRAELDNLESSLIEWEEIIALAVDPDKRGLWYEIDIHEPDDLPGFTDTNGTGNQDYAGMFSPNNLALPTGALDDIIEQAHKVQPDQKAWLTVEREAPANAVIYPGGYVPFANDFGGNVNCHYVFNYSVNGSQITMGVIYADNPDEYPVPSDKQVLDAVNASRTLGNYDPRSVLVIPKGTNLDIRKSIKAEKDYHATNNP